MMRNTLVLLAVIWGTSAGAAGDPGSMLAAFDAAVKAGKHVEATRVIEEALKDTQYKNPKLLHRGAEWASVRGDTAKMQSRYKLLADTAAAGSAELYAALTALLEAGVHPQLYLTFADQFGASQPELSWRHGVRQLDRLAGDGRGAESLAVLSRLLDTFGKDPGKVGALAWRVYRQVHELKLYPGADLLGRVWAACVASPQFPESTLRLILGYREKLVGREELARAVLEVHEHRKLVETWDVRRYFEQASGVKDAGIRKRLGRSYLALDGRYESGADVQAWRERLYVIARQPAVFFDTKLVTIEDIGARFAALRAEYGEPDSNLHRLMEEIQRHYLNRDAGLKLAFYLKWADVLPDTLVADFMSCGWNDTRARPRIDALIKGMPPARRLPLSSSLMVYANRTGNRALLTESTRGYMLWELTQFNPDHVLGQLFGCEALSTAVKLNALKPWVTRVGRSKAWDQLAAKLDKEKSVSASTQYKTFQTWCGKQKGTDVLARAVVTVTEAPVKPSTHDLKLAKAYKRGLSAFEGDVCAASRQQQPLEYRWVRALDAAYAKHVERNAKGYTERARLWLPRLKETAGSEWHSTLQRLRWLGGRGAVLAMTPHYGAALEASGKPGSMDWNWLRDWRPKPAADVMPFENVYGIMGTWGPWTLWYHYRNWWSPAFRNEQAMKMQHAMASAPNVTSRDRVRHLFFDGASAKTPFPTAFLDTLWRRCIADGAGTDGVQVESEAYALSCFFRSGKAAAGKAALTAYFAATAKRPAHEQVMSASKLLEVTAVPPDVQRQLLLTRLLPFAAKVTPRQARLVYLDRQVPEVASWLVRDKKITQAEYDRTMATLYRLIDQGARFYSAQGQFDRVFRAEADRALAADQWPAFMRAAHLLVRRMRAESSWGNVRRYHVDPLVAALEKKEAPEALYAFCDMITRVMIRNREQVQRDMGIVKMQASLNIPGLIGVPETDPTYDLFVAAQHLGAGNRTRAWELTEPKLRLLRQHWESLDTQYVVWSIDRMRVRASHKDALDFCFAVLEREMELPVELVARTYLLKGDTYRDMENYQAARAEYQSLTAISRFKDTEAGKDARLRLIELMILTRDFGAAEAASMALIDRGSLQDQAEGYYFLAQTAFEQGDYTAARDSLKETFKRKSGHILGRLLEGELRLLLPRGLTSTEVLIGNPELQTVAIPGRELTLKLQDANLSVARGGKAIPVVVTTGKGGDRETFDLIAASNDITLFSATIGTALGDAQPGNLRLELTGDDTVSYVIDPAFQKANDLDYPPKVLEIKSEAQLVASAGEILTEEEQEQLALERQLNPSPTSRRFEGRTGSTVRPGSPIYVQVSDADRDVGPDRDRVTVRAETSSGDVIQAAVLEETGAHTGVFSGTIPTGTPFPMARASDQEEGNDPNAVINVGKTGGWRSLADSRPPKWFEADTMSSHQVKSAELSMPDPGSVKRCRVLGTLGTDTHLLGVHPAESFQPKGGLVVQVRDNHRGLAPRQLRRWVQEGARKQIEIPQPVYKRSMVDEALKTKQRRQSTRIDGMFWLEESGELVLTWLGGRTQHRYLFLDGELVLRSNTQLARCYLRQGVHHLEVLAYDEWERNEQLDVGIVTAEGERKPMPAAWFSVAECPRLAAALKAKGVVSVSDTGIKVELPEPIRLKSIRWVFEDFTGTSIGANAVRIVDSTGAVVLPTDRDFASGLANDRLELAPGDDISISYEDTLRLDEDTPVCTASLDCSFFDGEASLAFEHIQTDSQGNERSDFVPAKRVTRGDQLMLIVTDYDLDLTDQPDAVPVTVRTSSGEELSLTARETSMDSRRGSDEHAGTFQEVLRFGETTGGNTIRLEPEDVVTVSYLDTENTDPGIPVERDYDVICPSAQQPRLKILDARIAMIEDRSPAALERLRRLRLTDGEQQDMVIMKEAIVADYAEEPTDPQRINSRTPLFLELHYPEMAKHADSTCTVTVQSELECRRAAAEGRDAEALAVPMRVGGLLDEARRKGYPITKGDLAHEGVDFLASGIFSGVVRLQVGSPGDPVDDLVRGEEQEFSAAPEETDDAFRVPTLVVSGADTLHITVRNSAGEPVLTRDAQLLSDAAIELLDSSYEVRRPAIHLGQKFHIRVADNDRDTSDERDVLDVSVAVEDGDAVSVALSETLEHSGVFTGTLQPQFVVRDAEGQRAAPDRTDDVLRVDFGDLLTFTVTDEQPLSQQQPLVLEVPGYVYKGSDAKLAGFSKRFKDPEMAVKTRFLTAEALFEMAKEHRKLGEDETARKEIAEGKRILEEAMRDYPETSLVAQGEYLLANLAQELGNYQEAVGRYAKVIGNWPDSEYASRSQLKKAICFEEMKQYDQATEEYVRLIYLYTDSPLVADATVRLGKYYYDNEQFDTAADIFAKFQENNPTHELAVRALFLAGQSLMKSENFSGAVGVYDRLVAKYPDEKDLRSEGMYWLGDAQFRMRDYVGAYRSFKQLTWDYPETKWAKIARGRLTEQALSKIEE